MSRRRLGMRGFGALEEDLEEGVTGRKADDDGYLSSDAWWSDAGSLEKSYDEVYPHAADPYDPEAFESFSEGMTDTPDASTGAGASLTDAVGDTLYDAWASLTDDDSGAGGGAPSSLVSTGDSLEDRIVEVHNLAFDEGEQDAKEGNDPSPEETAEFVIPDDTPSSEYGALHTAAIEGYKAGYLVGVGAGTGTGGGTGGGGGKVTPKKDPKVTPKPQPLAEGMSTGTMVVAGVGVAAAIGALVLVAKKKKGGR